MCNKQVKILIYTSLLLVFLFTNCTMPPIAFNNNIPVNDMPLNSSEVGFCPGEYWGQSDDLYVDFTYLNFWYRSYAKKGVDLGLRTFIILPEGGSYTAIIGPEMNLGIEPIKLLLGYYPFWINSEDGFHTETWWQANLLLGTTFKHLNCYVELKTARFAIGPIIGFNYIATNKIDLRSEISYLLPPPWEEGITGDGLSLSLDIVRKFGISE